MQVWKLMLALLGCVILAGCGNAETQNSADAQVPPDNATQGMPCIDQDPDSGEVLARGRLVQLDVSFDHRATWSGRIGGSDGAIELDAQSRVTGDASQLACAWDLEGGLVRYDLERVEVSGTHAFPARQSGSAQLSGTRLMQGTGLTVREEVDMQGPLEALTVRSIGLRESPDAEVCVVLAFEAPLQGRASRHVSAPGIQREESMSPRELAPDGYSALLPEGDGAGGYRFADQSFSICTGEAPVQMGLMQRPKGLSISADGKVWQRSGIWHQHASAPHEQRVVDFTMRVVPPSLPLD